MEKGFNRRQFLLIIVLLCIGHFSVDFMLSIWPVYKTMADLNLASAGLISGMCALLGESSQMLFGPLGDQGYYRRLAALGVALTTTSVLFIYASSYFFLFILFLMTYLGSGAFHPAAVGLVSSISGNSRRIIITVFLLSGALGMAFGQIIYTKALYILEGQMVFLTLPFIFFASLFFLPASEAEVDVVALKRKPQRTRVVDLIKFFRNRNLSLLYTTQVCAQTLLWVIIFLLPDVLSSRGYDFWLSYGGGHMAFILGFGFIMLPGIILAQRFSARRVILTAFLVGGTVCCFFLAIPFLSNSLVLCSLFILGASIGIVSPVALATGSIMVPHSPGAISAFLMGMAWCVAEAIGPTGGGLLTTLFETNAPAKALAVMSIFFVLGFGSMFFFEEAIPQEDT